MYIVYSPLCTQCTPWSSKISYKNVYETWIQDCIPNYNSLASQTRKLEKQPTLHCLQPTVHPVHTLIFKNNLQNCLWNLNSSLHTKFEKRQKVAGFYSKNFSWLFCFLANSSCWYISNLFARETNLKKKHIVSLF